MKNKYWIFGIKVLTIVLPVCIFFELLMKLGYGPLLTNSISFDEKVKNLQKNKIEQIDLAAIGSSITLNNLSSRVINDSIKLSYFNFSSWGLEIADIKEMTINYLPRYKFKYLIVCSSITDFTTDGNAKAIKNYLSVNDYFKDHFKEYFYLHNYNSLINIRQRKQEISKLLADSNYYDSVNFDSYGGVMLNIEKKYISAQRWNMIGGFPTEYTNRQYDELILLSQFLKKHNVKLIFVQSPIRKAYVNNSKTQQIVGDHFKRCKRIVEQYGGLYMNFYNPVKFSADSLFVDQFHLSAAGATVFTREMTHQLKATLAL